MLYYITAFQHHMIDRALGEATAHGETGVPGTDNECGDSANGGRSAASTISRGMTVTKSASSHITKPSTLAGTIAARLASSSGPRYSGVFIPRLANPNVLVITAADADHSSFGCQEKAKWTYFGDAFFNVALRQTKSLKDAFVVARALVQKHELREHFEPSNPLMAGGANVQPLLIAHP